MIRVLAMTAALALSFASAAHAACSGQDLRPTLTAEERSALAEGLAQRPYPTGNHWRATRGDEVLHLVGTVHLGDPRLDGPVARIAPVVQSAATVLLEMTAVERKELQSAMATKPDLLLLEGATLPDLLPEDEWQRLSKALQARGMPAFMAARFRPWYVSMLLALPPCLATAMKEQDGLDARIEALAEAATVPVAALEPFDTGFRAFDAVPLEAQINLLRTSLMEPADGEDMFATVVDSYLEEDHAESWLLTQILAPRFSPVTDDDQVFLDTLGKALLDDRNAQWIPVILRTLDTTEGPVVAAFGAGHLSGEAGVLRLLEQRGFALERMPF